MAGGWRVAADALPGDRAQPPHARSSRQAEGSRLVCPSRRRVPVPECSELTERACRPDLPPEAPAASAARGGAEAGTAWDRRCPGRGPERGRGGSAGGAPRAGRSPLAQLAAGQACGRKEGVKREEEKEREGGEKEGGTAAPLPHLSITQQIKYPRWAPGRGMSQSTKEPLLHFSDKRLSLGPSCLELCPVLAAPTLGRSSDSVK